MLKKLIVIINCFVLFYSPIAYTACQKPVELLNKGNAAPCTGYLFSPDKNKELFKINEEHKIYKQQLEMKDLLINNLYYDIKKHNEAFEKSREQTEVWEKRANETTDKLFKTQESRGTRDFMFILMGVGMTVLAGWAIGQAK